MEELVELGAKELKLSNGMVVVFRHSDMQEDQILLSVRARNCYLHTSIVVVRELELAVLWLACDADECMHRKWVSDVEAA